MEIVRIQVMETTIKEKSQHLYLNNISLYSRVSRVRFLFCAHTYVYVYNSVQFLMRVWHFFCELLTLSTGSLRDLPSLVRFWSGSPFSYNHSMLFADKTSPIKYILSRMIFLPFISLYSSRLIIAIIHKGARHEETNQYHTHSLALADRLRRVFLSW